MFSGFSGWHLLLLAAFALISLAVTIGVIALVVRLVRRGDPERMRLRAEAEAQRARAERAERDTDGLV